MSFLNFKGWNKKSAEMTEKKNGDVFAEKIRTEAGKWKSYCIKRMFCFPSAPAENASSNA